jgi:hypothetical protein
MSEVFYSLDTLKNQPLIQGMRKETMPNGIVLGAVGGIMRDGNFHGQFIN